MFGGNNKKKSNENKNEITSPATTTSPPMTADSRSKDGNFIRRDAGWRSWISREPDAEFPPAAGRYHLYVAAACGWANRTLLVRKLKGLEDCISITMVLPTWRHTKPGIDEHCGWVFANPNGEPYKTPNEMGGPVPATMVGCDPDPEYNAYSIREIYEKAGDVNQLYSVPILWDKIKKTIVSNESADIIQMLNSEFNDYAKNPDLNLYPNDMKEQIDSVNEWIYPDFNNGVYRCGFAKTQDAYDAAIASLTEAFDKLDKILQTSRFIAGDRLSLADIRLFPTLLRYDEVYSCYFKANTRLIAYTPSILNYCREIYQMEGIAETIIMDQIKQHYYTSHPTFNHFGIIPKGMNFIQLLQEPHDRWKIGHPLEFLFHLLPFL